MFPRSVIHARLEIGPLLSDESVIADDVVDFHYESHVSLYSCRTFEYFFVMPLDERGIR